MLSLDIHHNYNGKLFADYFSHLVVYSPEFVVNEEVAIVYENFHMGIARIEAVRQFPFNRIFDAVSFLNMGKPAVYQAAQLNEMHNDGKTLPGDTTIMHLVLGYVHRDIEIQSRLMTKWWDAKKKVYEHNY